VSSQRIRAITALEYSWTRAAYSCPAARGVIGSSLSRLSYSSSTAFRRVRALVTELCSVARSGTAMGYQSSTIEEARLCQIGQTHLRAPSPSSPKAGIQSYRDVVLPLSRTGVARWFVWPPICDSWMHFGVSLLRFRHRRATKPRRSCPRRAQGTVDTSFQTQRILRLTKRRASLFGARRFSIFSQPDYVRKILREKLKNLVVGSEACLRGSRNGA